MFFKKKLSSLKTTETSLIHMPPNITQFNCAYSTTIRPCHAETPNTYPNTDRNTNVITTSWSGSTDRRPKKNFSRHRQYQPSVPHLPARALTRISTALTGTWVGFGLTGFLKGMHKDEHVKLQISSDCATYITYNRSCNFCTNNFF
jgi:hypothetical protein